MSVPEAARQLGMTPEMVRRHIASGRLPAERLGKRIWIVRPEDLAAFIADRPKRGWPKGKLRKPAAPPEAQ